MIHAVGSSYQAEAIDTSITAPQPPAATQGVPKSGDTVDLSDKGKMVAAFFADLGVEYQPGKAITLDDLEAGLRKTEKQFRDDTATLFLENGIPLDPPVELTSDSEGSVRVNGDHPYKQQIEQLFEENPELSNDFRKTSALSSMVEAGREYIEFSREYAKDPYAAVAKYGHLFDKMQDAPFSLAIGGETHSQTA